MFVLRSLPVLFLSLAALATSSAISFSIFAREPQKTDSQKRSIVARGYLTGTGGLEYVVVQRRGKGPGAILRLMVETPGKPPNVLWESDHQSYATVIDSVRVAQLDNDGNDKLPEIIGLWRQSASERGRLRIFRWDPRTGSFGELQPGSNSDLAGLTDVMRYGLRGNPGRRRIVVLNGSRNSQFEVRGWEIVRVEGGVQVKPEAECGIEGQAVISPARPGPVRQGDPGTAPYQTTLVVERTSDGNEVTRFQTDSDGRFRVSLPPGEYRIGPPPQQPAKRFPIGSQHLVQVLPGRFTTVTIEFDSGMR